MIVFINALSARLGGGQTYLQNLLENIENFNGDKIYILAQESLNIPSHNKIERICAFGLTKSPIIRAVWEFFFLHKILKRLKVNVVFCPGGFAFFRIPKYCKLVTTFQNMTPFDKKQLTKYSFGYNFLRLHLLKKLMTRTMLKADAVIFISNYAKDVINSCLDNKVKKYIVIPHGINKAFIDINNIQRPKWLPIEDYLLYVSAFDVYKNQIEVIRAFSIFKSKHNKKFKLLLIGNHSNTYISRVNKEIEKLNMFGDVIMPGNIRYDLLPAAYHFATINIFASECENCPNILLEMLAAGKPILCSNYEPMPEFAGNATMYFDPRDTKDLADKIYTCVSNKEISNSLSGRAIERSKIFTWSKSSSSTWKIMEDSFTSSPQ